MLISQKPPEEFLHLRVRTQALPLGRTIKPYNSLQEFEVTDTQSRFLFSKQFR